MQKRILIIDDDPAVTESLGAALSPPYIIAIACDGRSALAFLGAESAHLVLLDIALGGEDGLELLPSLRDVTPAPILVLTGFGTRENLLRAIWARPDGFLDKPIPLEELRRRVAAFLDESTPEADALEGVRTWIGRECHRRITIKDIARAAGMSPAYLYRSFVERFCLTPRAYLVQSRMQRAATLLRESNSPLKELAPNVGVSDASNFSRVFKRVHGCTPEAFRNEGRRCSPKKTD